MDNRPMGCIVTIDLQRMTESEVFRRFLYVILSCFLFSLQLLERKAVAKKERQKRKKRQEQSDIPLLLEIEQRDAQLRAQL